MAVVTVRLLVVGLGGWDAASIGNGAVSDSGDGRGGAELGSGSVESTGDASYLRREAADASVYVVIP